MYSTLAVMRDYKGYVIDNGISKGRHRRNILYKYAYINALRQYFGCSEIGRIVGLHHATILHAWKTHDQNISPMHNPEMKTYQDAFEDAVYRLQTILGEEFDEMIYWNRADIIKAYRELEKKYNDLIDATKYSIEEEEVSGVLLSE